MAWIATTATSGYVSEENFYFVKLGQIFENPPKVGDKIKVKFDGQEIELIGEKINDNSDGKFSVFERVIGYIINNNYHSIADVTFGYNYRESNAD